MTIERAAKALWKLECEISDKEYLREGRSPPEKWANPWDESGCGVKQQPHYLRSARAALEAIAEPTSEMIDAGHRRDYVSKDKVERIWHAMHAAMMRE